MHQWFTLENIKVYPDIPDHIQTVPMIYTIYIYTI